MTNKAIYDAIENGEFPDKYYDRESLICGCADTSEQIICSGKNWNDRFVVSWILTGTGEYRENGAEYKLCDCCVCIRRPDRDYLMHLERERSVRLYIDLPSCVYAMLRHLFPELFSIAPVAAVPYSETLKNEFMALLTAFRGTANKDIYILIPDIIQWLIDITGIASERENDPLTRARLILSDPVQDVPLESIAESCGMSYAAFRRKFTETCGVPPGKYRINCRIDSARRALASGMSVSETAQIFGYPDIYTFSHQFTAVCGISPAKYARQCRK